MKKRGRAYAFVDGIGVDKVSQEVAAPQEESLPHHVGYETAAKRQRSDSWSAIVNVTTA